jgi:hypothetical protein
MVLRRQEPAGVDVARDLIRLVDVSSGDVRPPNPYLLAIPRRRVPQKGQ